MPHDRGRSGDLLARMSCVHCVRLHLVAGSKDFFEEDAVLSLMSGPASSRRCAALLGLQQMTDDHASWKTYHDGDAGFMVAPQDEMPAIFARIT